MSFWHDAGHMPGHWSLSGSLPSLPRAHVDSSLPQTTLSIKVSSARSHAVLSSSRRVAVELVFLVSAFLSARCCCAEDASTKPKTVGCLYNVTKPSPNWTFETACRTTRDRSSHASAPGAASFNRAASFASISAFESMLPSWGFSLSPDFASGAAATGGVVALSYSNGVVTVMSSLLDPERAVER